MYNTQKEIESLAKDLNNAGYIAKIEKECSSDDNLINNENRIVHELKNFAFEDIFDWIRGNTDKNSKNAVEVNSLCQRLNILQYFLSDMGINLFNHLIEILPNIGNDADTISSDRQDCLCVRTREEAETVKKILESVSKASRFDTCFAVDYHDLEQDEKNNAVDIYTGWYTIEIK